MVVEEASKEELTTTYAEENSGSSKKEILSVFSDTACGEPISSQHLVIDFTPQAEDADFLREKCCDFWTFVAAQPELEELMCFSVHLFKFRNIPPTISKEVGGEFVEIEKEGAIAPPGRTAISMLKLADDAGLTEEAFETKLPKSRCSLGSREYIDAETLKRQTNRKKYNLVCNCNKMCPCILHQQAPPPHSLYKQMRSWDKVHPKSFDQPGHPPAPGPSLHDMTFATQLTTHSK